MSLFFRRFIVAAALGAAVSAPVSAKELSSADEARAIPVRYADLDLQQTSDAAALFSRLRYAASRACEAQFAQPGPAARRAIQACEAQALEAAVTRLNQAELTRLHAAQRQ